MTITSNNQPFYGRSAQLEAIDDLLRAGRSVVISGPPGIGKTTLARQAVSAHAGNWRQIEIGPRPLIAMTTAFDVATESRPETELAAAVGRAIYERNLAGVVFDNATALADHADLLAICQREARVPIVVTSRRRLGFEDFTSIELGPLDPTSAVLLFEQVARVDAPRGDIESLVQRLEFHPLAVKLAASRADILPPAQLIGRLGSSKNPLVSGLDASIESSWELLEPAQKLGLATLAIFPSGFTLELAEAVLQVDAFDLISSLVDACWLVREEAGGAPKFALWSILREFVLRRTPPAAREAFALGLLELALRTHRDVTTEAGDAALDLLVTHYESFQRGLELCGQESPARALEFCRALSWPGRLAQDPRSVARAYAHAAERADSTGVTDPELASIFALIGEQRMRLGDVGEASDILERAVAMVRDSDSPFVAEILRLSSLPLAELDPSVAIERLDDAADRAGDPVERALVEVRRGFLALRTFRLEQARDSLASASNALRNSAARVLRGPCTTGLAYVALRTGHLESAAIAFNESVDIFAAANDPLREAQARFNHAVAMLALGDVDTAHSQLERAQAIWRRCGEDRFDAVAGVRAGLIRLERTEYVAAREAARDAIRAGQQRGDWHNRAIAELVLALVDLAEHGRLRSTDALDAALTELEFATDPDASSAALTLRAVASAQRGRHDEAHEQLDRLGGILGVIGDEDLYLHGIVESLLALGRTWVAVAGDGELSPESRGILARVPSLVANPGEAAAEIDALSNSYLRILARALANELVTSDVDDSSIFEPTFLGMMPPSSAAMVVTIHRGGHWFRIDDGEVIDLLPRRPLRLILRSILRSHIADSMPGRSVADLVSDGWPDEFIEANAGKNRVYNAVRTLRDLGLEGAIVTADESGYRFAPSIALQVVDTTPSQVVPLLTPG